MTPPRDTEVNEGWCVDCHHWPEEHGDPYHDRHCECVAFVAVAQEDSAS